MSSYSAEVRLPPPVAALVDGRDLDRKIGPTISVMAAGEDLWPRLALLSVGEVLSSDGTDLRLALYGGSRTTAALTHSGKALVNVVLDGTIYKIRAEFERVDVTDDPLAYFLGHVDGVDEDRVGYAQITSGLSFELNDRKWALDRWAKQVDRLRRLTP